MFPVIVNDGQTPFPDDDIYYIVCKEGVYLKKKLGVMESIAPVKNISILKSIETMATMHIKKIPAIKVQQIINFFKAVYKEYHAEAIVLLFYNQNTKKYKIICPHQEVSGAGADYSKGIVIEDYDMIGTIHSHASMSAFHSGIDDTDEKNFDGLHITFGNMRDDDISVSASIVANGFRVIVDPRDYINQMEMTVNIDEEEKVSYAKSWKWDVNLKKMVEIQTAGRFYTRRNFDQRFKVRLSKDPKFDPKWMDLVEKKTYSYKTATVGANWWDGWYGHDSGYGEGSYWKNWRGHQNTKGVKPITPGTANLPVVVKPKENLLIPSGKPTTNNPCDACAFQHHKFIPSLDKLPESAKQDIIDWALDQLDKDANYTMSGSLDDVDELVHYHCINCQEKFTVDESENSTGEACCPKCGVDDYLMEISAIEMMMEGSIESTPSDEEIEVDGLGMIECKNCNSSFTKDFLVNGECPTCHVILVAKNYLENTEDILHNQSNSDSGDYLDPDRDAIEKAIAADQDLERIPVPGQAQPINKQRKSGIFASMFKRKKS